MPSPFPGMDPYLEDPALWPDVHHSLISEIQASLNVRIRPKYTARVEERVYIADESDPGVSAGMTKKLIIPDVHVVEREGHGRISAPGRPAAVLENVAEPVDAVTFLEEEVREAYLTVFDRASREAVTIIEILSPTNKTTGSAGLDSYLEKRRQVMNSATHFVEIDLLRGPRPFPVGIRSIAHDYLVHVSRAGKRPRGTLWPIRLTQRLPLIPIPLKAGDPDAALDLQEVLNTAYDRAGYDLAVDYRRDPVPPLEGELAGWARQIADKAAAAGPR